MNVQDGPGVGLICRLRFLLCVTDADQGAQVITTRCKAQKPIMEQKDDQGYNHSKHDATHPKQESQRQNQPHLMPIRRSLQPSERHELRKSAIIKLVTAKKW